MCSYTLTQLPTKNSTPNPRQAVSIYIPMQKRCLLWSLYLERSCNSCLNVVAGRNCGRLWTDPSRTSVATQEYALTQGCRSNSNVDSKGALITTSTISYNAHYFPEAKRSMFVELFTILLVIFVFTSSGFSDEQIEIQARALRGIVFLIQRNTFIIWILRKSL